MRSLIAAWKLVPALVAGNCVVLKPAEQIPVSILVLIEFIQDLLPPGTLKEEGAKVLCGGEAYNNETYPDGFYIQPTLLKPK